MTGRQLTNPLQSLLATAAKTLPKSTGVVAQFQARMDRRQGSVVILADVSTSMASAAWGGQRKIDILREAVATARRHTVLDLIAFSTHVERVDVIPEPRGGTDLAAGLAAAHALDPGVTLVISDGHPDDQKRALQIAGTFRGAIDVLYIGPESDAAALAFMRRLAAAAGGDVRAHDIAKAGTQRLAQSIAALLPAPR